MSKTVAEALAAVMAEVRRLEKSATNTHANYKFTSVDDFKDALRPLFATHGLTVRCDQTGFAMFPVKGKNGETLAAQFDFEFVLATAAGEDKPERSTVVLPYTGAQTTGIARSYALKEYLKTRVMASSGDQEDADFAPTSEYSPAASRTPAPSKAASRSTYTALEADLHACTSREAVLQWAADNSDTLNALPADWQATIRNDAKSMIREFTSKKEPA